MNEPEQNTDITEAVGMVIGEVLETVSLIVGALRKQPGFDNGAFDQEIRAIADKPETGMLQKHAMEMLLNAQQRSE